MDKDRLRRFFIITILIIIIIFSIVLYIFNTIEAQVEGMMFSNPYEPYAILNKAIK
jgi:hypothetical protein